MRAKTRIADEEKGIGREISEDKESCRKDGGIDDEEDIMIGNCFEHQLAHSRPGEDSLGHSRAASDRTKINRYNGN